MANEQTGLIAAYLIVGEDALKRRTVLERLRARVAESGDLEFNHDEFNGQQASGTDIAASCNTLPFASGLRLVEVKHGEALGKQDQDILTAYLASPSPTTVLALEAEKLAKNTRLYKAFSALGKDAVIDCSPMKRFELVRALRSMAVGHGFTITEAGAAALIELVGQNTLALDSELRKLALSHKGSDPVTDREVRALVQRVTSAKPWELVDAMCERDLPACLSLLPHVDASPYALIGMCVARFRELACAQSLSARGQAADLAQTLKVPAWRVKNHLRWSRGFSGAELRRAFSSARDCERAMKSGADPDSAFRTWLIAVVPRT